MQCYLYFAYILLQYNAFQLIVILRVVNKKYYMLYIYIIYILIVKSKIIKKVEKD